MISIPHARHSMRHAAPATPSTQSSTRLRNSAPRDQLTQPSIFLGPIFLGPLIRAFIACNLALLSLILLAATPASAQGGPPYYTNDPGTPGTMNWEINLGYMPFLYNGNSVSHTPDVDINFGPNDRVQLTYESAWLRVHIPGEPVKFGMEQSQLGFKWRFYDSQEHDSEDHGSSEKAAGDPPPADSVEPGRGPSDHAQDTGELAGLGKGMAFSIFPQLSVNNPNNAVRRGIAPPGDTLILPLEFTKKLGPVDINLEGGYQVIQHAPNGWLTGLVVGHEFSKRLELDAEFYSTGTFHPAYAQPTLDVGGRYRMHYPLILLFMAGRGVEPARSNQPYFLGYFGVQILLPHRSFDKD